MESKIKNKPKLDVGCKVSYQTITYLVTRIISPEEFIARRFDNGVTEKLKTEDVLVFEDEASRDQDLISVSDSSWEEARKKLEIITPLLNKPKKTSEEVEKRAQEMNVHSTTIYRWINKYEQSGKLSSLLPIRRTGGKGKSRLSDEVNEILNDVIQNFFLSKERPSVPKTIKRVVSICKQKGLKPPSRNTIRARIDKIGEKVRVQGRVGVKEAIEQFGAYPKKYSEATVPLSVIQIDHTPLDLMVVDEKYRLSIGRPWLTLAIDVFSRAVTAFYLSLEKPSSLSVGQCISQSVLPKESRMAELDLETHWPIMGIPSSIHVDNAKEFDSNMLERACHEYNIDIHIRPVAKANYGGHIERYLGTLNTEIHNLPGTTYSNTVQRGRYKSEDKAVFTLREIERWITVYICDVYHKSIHSETHMMPLEKFKNGLLGDEHSFGIGAPKLPYDSDRFKMDFLPYVERTVQQHGIRINGINYYHDVLKTWIHAKDDELRKYKQKFIIRYDPRDISKVYFFDPELKRYFEISYRNISAPRMTLWELREVQRVLKERGLENYDEESIFIAYAKLRELEKESMEKTKKERRRASRRFNANANLPKRAKKIEVEQSDLSDDDEEITPFDDIQY